jgi:hypothetical protein
MFSNRIIWTTAIVIGMAAADRRAAGQDFSLAAEPAKKKFDAKVEELRAKYRIEIKVADAEYTVKLNELIKIASANGDLEKVLAFKAEKEWIDDGKLPKDTAASLKLVQTMRSAYEVRKKAANANYDKGAKQAQAEFLTDLESVVKEETKEGRIESALKVRETKKEIEKANLPPAVAPEAPIKPLAKETVPLKPEPAPMPTPKTEPEPKAIETKPVSNDDRFNETVPITSKKEIGYEIGAVAKGEKIVLEYVGGKWKGWGKQASSSPDDPADKSNINRLAICEATKEGSTTVLEVVPTATKSKPYEWIADKDYEKLALRINDTDGNFGNNPDAGVKYRLRIVKAK